MPTRQRLGSGGSGIEWPSIAICAMVFGFMTLVAFRDAPAGSGTASPVQRLMAWRGWRAEPEARQALVITANRRDQLTVVATLSPRGFVPLLAGSAPEVLSQIQAHPGALRLAVVDATLPDYALIARALKDILPTSGIIVLQGPDRSQDIGPMLLDRLPLVL